MAVLKLLLTGGIIFITAIAFSKNTILRYNSDINVNYRLPKYIVPQQYSVKLVLHIEEHTNNIGVSGQLYAIICIHALTHFIPLHILNINMTKIQLFKADSFKPMECVSKNYNNQTQIVELDCGRPLLPGTFDLYITFNTTYNNVESIFRTSYIYKGHKKWLVATTFLPIGARRVFPCWDEPALKVNFSFTVTYHNKYKVLTNMHWNFDHGMIDKDMYQKGFAPTFKISTYQVAIIVCDSDSFKIHDSNFMHSRQNVTIQFAETIVGTVRKYFESKELLNDIPIHHARKYFVIPGFLHDGTSYWNLVFYREAAIIYDVELDSIMRQIEVARLVACNEAQQLLGSLISPSWWSSWWLNDALAIYLGMNAINKYFSDFRIMDLFVVQQIHESLHWDFYSNYSIYPLQVNDSSEINSLFTSPSSFKAVSMLHMLSNLVTDEMFWYGVHEYLSKRAYNSTTPDDLWTAIEIALANIYNYVDRENYFKPRFTQIKKKMNYWIKLIVKHPVLKATRINDSLEIEIETEKTELELDWLPVTFTTEEWPDFDQNLLHNAKYVTARKSKIELRKQEKIDTFGWVIVNLQQVGYYRVNYDDENWLKIARYLNSLNYTKIHVLNRAQIIDDAFHFMMATQLNTSIFWELTSYLSKETDYVAWYPMFKALECMSTIFPLPDKKVEDIKTKVLKILDGLLTKIGYNEEENSNESTLTRCLRQEATKWACVFGDSECRSNASKKLEWHLNNIKTHKLLPWWKEWTYCNGLMLANSTTWRHVLDKIHWLDERNLKFSACSENISHIVSSLNYFSSIDYNVKTNNFIKNFFFTVAKHAKNNEMLGFMLQTLESMKHTQISVIAVLIIIINNIYSKEGLDMIHFMNLNNTINVGKYAEKTIEQVTANFLHETEMDFSELASKYISNIESHGILNNFTDNGENNTEAHLSGNLNKFVKIRTVLLIIVERKIQVRLLEIEKQMKYLQIF